MSTKPTYDELQLRVKALEAAEADPERSHEMLRQSEEKYRSLFDHMLHEVHLWEVVRDESGAIRTWRLVDANPAALKSWGKSLPEVVGKTTDEVFPDANATNLFMPVVKKIFSDGNPHIWESFFPGTGQVLHMISIPFGECFMSTGVDITVHKQKEEDLKNAVLRLSEAIHAGNIGLWDWDLISNEVFYSTEWKRQIGYEDDEISNALTEYDDRIHPDDLAATRTARKKSIAKALKNYESEFRFQHKDGSYRWILAHGSIIQDDQGNPVRMVGSHTDLTDRKQLEVHLRETQKMESIGILAGGIAHDFNNILTAILGNVSMAKNSAAPQSELLELLSEAEMASIRAKSLTKQLLTFSKGGSPVKEIVSMQAIIEDSVSFAARGSKSRCNFSIADDLWPVEVDVGQMTQVLNNLVINAAQSMPEGGAMYVSAENVELDERNLSNLDPGRYIRVSIRDEGIGIPETHLGKIFDPYFSTKQAGSGLGLSISYSIIHNHGGRINVESEFGNGATFHIYLSASEQAPPKMENVQEIEAGEGRILVMDDEQSVRKVLKMMLGRLGYETDLTEHGDQAIAAYKAAKESGAPYDALILDLTIVGGMGGMQTLEQLLAIDPDVKAIVSSGYSDNMILANYEECGFKGYLDKPYDLVSLSIKLHEVMR